MNKDIFYVRKLRFTKHWHRYVFVNQKLSINGCVVAPSRDHAKRKIRRLHPDIDVRFWC